MKKGGKITARVITLFLIIISFFLCTSSVFAIGPFGANLTILNTSTAPQDAAQSVAAQAGNVTEINVFGYSTTQTWQGYFGNVTGTIQLADGSSNVLYNWSNANPKGEIYASTNSSIQWANTQCFNFSATGTYASDTAQAGATSLFGTNITQLESQFGITNEDVDGVNETFIYSGAGTGHNLFYTGSLLFSEGECRSTRIFDSSGSGVADNFEEVLLYEPASTSVIFGSLLNQNSFGFDQRTHDFQMLVLEDGHGTNVAATPYYFYVELQ